MSELKTQKDFWDDRAKSFERVGPPLIPTEEDVEFQKRQLIKGGKVLILGVTPSTCTVAKSIAAEVTAVDFSEGMIRKLRQDDVRYVCMSWLDYFQQTTKKYDNILTDAGLACVDYPDAWHLMAQEIEDHLIDGGIFSARFFLSTTNPPKEHYENPGMDRIVPTMANLDANWMRTRQADNYQAYDVPWTFPPKDVVLQNFGRMTLVETLVPAFDEGERFASFAWRKSKE